MSNMLRRLAGLLNQAENASTEAEAEAFMTAAQRLSTSYSIPLALARHATKEKERTAPIARSVTIGVYGDRGLGTLVDLFLGIADANDIKCSIAHSKTTVYAHGFAEDIDVAEAMYASLLVQQARYAAEYKETGDWQQETTTREGRYRWVNPATGKCPQVDHRERGYYRSDPGRAWDKDGNELERRWFDSARVPISWMTAKLNFQDGFAGRIRGRLAEARYEKRERQMKMEQHRAARPHLDEDGHVTADFAAWLDVNHGIDLDDLEDKSGEGAVMSEVLRDIDNTLTSELVEQWKTQLASPSSGAELVLAEKKKQVNDFYYDEHPSFKKKRIRHYDSGRDNRKNAWGAQSAGRSAADRASLGGSTSIGGTKGAIER